MAIFKGSNSHDVFLGTPDPDDIRGGGGIDLLRGGAGYDSINGGDGPDSLYGDLGNDTISGGDGDDVIRGGKGHDFLWGGEGDDVVRGDLGNDDIDGGFGDDVIGGGQGNDTLTGFLGDDVLRGDLGNDTIFATSGNDYADGGPGDDLIYAGIEEAFVDGGAGDDTISYDRYDPQYNDSLHFGWLDPATRTVAAVTRYDGEDAAGRDLIVNVETFVLSFVDDWMLGNEYPSDDAQRITVDGGPGNDSLVGYRGDTLIGGAGDDWLWIHDHGTATGDGATADDYWRDGADTFAFFGEAVDGAVITDFSQDDGDRIYLSSDGFSGVDDDALQAMLDGSSGNVLDLSLLNVPDMEHGAVTLEGVQVADLTVEDFVLPG